MTRLANDGSSLLRQSNNALYRAGGYLFFAIGFVGIVVPVMPTTVFWIIAAALFAKSSPDMYRRIRDWPGLGNAIADYLDYGVVRPRAKILSVSGMALGALILLMTPLPAPALVAALFGLAGAAGYVLTRAPAKDSRSRCRRSGSGPSAACGNGGRGRPGHRRCGAVPTS